MKLELSTLYKIRRREGLVKKKKETPFSQKRK
jgi:hypothetical protein